MSKKNIVAHTHLFVLLSAFPVASRGQEITTGGRHENTTLVYPPFRHAPVHKATRVHLLAFMALIGRTDIAPDDPQGIAVTRLTATDDPDNRNDDDDLTAYGLNSGQNCLIFNSSIQSLDVFEGKGRQQKLKKPRGIAATPGGDIYVTDTGNHRIIRLRNPGNYVEFVGAVGKKGSAKNQLDSPSGIAVGPRGYVYVCDTENNRVQIFDRDLNYVAQFGIPSQTTSHEELFFRPDGIAITGADGEQTYSGESFAVVIDLNNSRVRKFTLNGQFVAGILANDYGYPQAFLTSVAVDYFGNVWVTDTFHHCVHKFDSNLRYITTFGHVGEGENEFLEPRSIAIWKPHGQVFVIDKISAQYFHIGTDILEPRISLADSSIQIDFLLTEHSRLTATILDENDQTIATLCSNKLLPIGRHTLTWDRTPPGKKFARTDSTAVDSAAVVSLMPSGLYSIRFQARTTYRYSRYFTKTLQIDFAY